MKFNMKRLTLPLLLLLTNAAWAQWNNAGQQDNYINTAGSVSSSAVIDYSNVATCASCTGPHQLYALVETGITNNIMLQITDDGTHTTLATLSWSVSGPALGQPNVIIGNVRANTSDLYVAVVYVDGGNIYLKQYRISGAGSGSLAVVSSSTSAITSGIGANYQHPAIDIIPEYGNLWYINGASVRLPFCNKFMIAYIDPSLNNLDVYYGDLNGLIVPNSLSYSTGATTLGTCDVAGIQKLNGSGALDDYAIFVYSDKSTTPVTMYTLEWEEGTGSATILSSQTVNQVKEMYIDAMKDYNIYGSGGVDWLVTYADNNLLRTVYEFSNLSAMNVSAGPGTWAFDLSTYDDFFPFVAIGPGSYYSIVYNTDYSTSSPYDIVAQQIDLSTGGFVSPDYYEVPHNHNDNAGIASIASSCNTNAGTVVNLPYLYTFFYYNGTVSPGAGYYEKSTADPYAFKHEPTAVSNVLNYKDWAVNPNPATTQFYINAPNGVVDHNSYTLTDVTGRSIMNGAINSGRQEVNIESLPNGMYMIHIYKDNNQVKTMKVVKE